MKRYRQVPTPDADRIASDSFQGEPNEDEDPEFRDIESYSLSQEELLALLAYVKTANTFLIRPIRPRVAHLDGEVTW